MCVCVCVCVCLSVCLYVCIVSTLDWVGGCACELCPRVCVRVCVCVLLSPFSHCTTIAPHCCGPVLQGDGVQSERHRIGVQSSGLLPALHPRRFRQIRCGRCLQKEKGSQQEQVLFSDARNVETIALGDAPLSKVLHSCRSRYFAGNLSFQKLQAKLTSSRFLAYHIPSREGHTFLEYDVMTSERYTFMASSETHVRNAQAPLAPSLLKSGPKLCESGQLQPLNIVTCDKRGGGRRRLFSGFEHRALWICSA